LPPLHWTDYRPPKRTVQFSGFTTYTAADPEYPPYWRNFEQWPGPIAFIKDGQEPLTGDVVRVWYTKPHTLNGLGSASATTFPAGDDQIILTGASAIAALARSIETTETLNVDGWVGRRLKEWGDLQEARFQHYLDELARREAARQSGIAPTADLDRWDDQWA
jgi:hypothetical protein